jgi:hypothetical protein
MGIQRVSQSEFSFELEKLSTKFAEFNEPVREPKSNKK